MTIFEIEGELSKLSRHVAEAISQTENADAKMSLENTYDAVREALSHIRTARDDITYA